MSRNRSAAGTASATYRFDVEGLKKWTSDEPRAGVLELTVDWAKLARTLGVKAAFNSNRKTGLAIGLKAKFIPKV